MASKAGEEDRGSEEILEMYCEVCKKKGKDRSADGFCVECVRYFCTNCLEYHTEFLPNHVHRDKKNMPQDVCVNPCPGHAEEIIKFYCSSCNMFFCSLCKQNQHSGCRGVNHLPEMVHQVEQSKQFKEFARDLEEVSAEVNNIESVIECDKESIDGLSRTAMSAIDSTRQRFFKLLDDRIEEIKREVKSKKDRDKKAFEDTSYRLSAIKSQVIAIKMKSEQNQTDEKRCELFMLMKENDSKSLKDELKQLKECNVSKYAFEVSTEDELFFTNTFKFGRLVNSTSKELRKELVSSTDSSGNCQPIVIESVAKPKKIENKATADICPSDNAVPGLTQNKSERKVLKKKTEKRMDESNTPRKKVSDTIEQKAAQKLMSVKEMDDVETQKSFIANQLQRPLIKGETWYLLDIKWFKQWKSYVGYESWDQYNVGEDLAHPGPIDNTPAFQEGTTELKKQLIDDLDYQLVPEEGWHKLVSWYGILDGQEPIARRVIEEGVYSKSLKIEVYLWHLELFENSNPDHQVSKQFSKADTVGQLEEVMRKQFSIPAEKEVRLWNNYKPNMYEQLNKKDDTIQCAGVYKGQVIVIEQKNCDGTWPRGKGKTK